MSKRAAVYVSGSVLDISKQTSRLVMFCKRRSNILEDDHSDFDGDTGSPCMMVAKMMHYRLGVLVVFSECDTFARYEYPEEMIDERVRK